MTSSRCTSALDAAFIARARPGSPRTPVDGRRGGHCRATHRRPHRRTAGPMTAPVTVAYLRRARAQWQHAARADAGRIAGRRRRRRGGAPASSGGCRTTRPAPVASPSRRAWVLAGWSGDERVRRMGPRRRRRRGAAANDRVDRNRYLVLLVLPVGAVLPATPLVAHAARARPALRGDVASGRPGRR